MNEPYLNYPSFFFLNKHALNKNLTRLIITFKLPLTFVALDVQGLLSL